ncbi:MAG: TPM domain-containing protein [Lachnospiraceae bacterium]|nr:TPM domain-containing protein [Lachnospiraceae bacterium]
MRKSLRCQMTAVLLILLMCFGAQTAAAEESTFYNEETQNAAVIDDAADLLSDAEEEQLVNVMWPITAYGHVLFVSTAENDRSAEEYAEECYKTYFGQEDGCLFLMDMTNRKLWLYNSGDISYTITSAYADTITDNVYKMASRKEYYCCAEEAFTQITALLEGEEIPQPMKYISNALLALIIAFFGNYLLIHPFRAQKMSVEEQQMETLLNRYRFSGVKKKKYQTERTLNSSDSSDGDSSGGGGGGGSSSGGGHSF